MQAGRAKKDSEQGCRAPLDRDGESSPMKRTPCHLMVNAGLSNDVREIETRKVQGEGKNKDAAGPKKGKWPQGRAGGGPAESKGAK